MHCTKPVWFFIYLFFWQLPIISSAFYCSFTMFSWKLIKQVVNKNTDGCEECRMGHTAEVSGALSVLNFSHSTVTSTPLLNCLMWWFLRTTSPPKWPRAYAVAQAKTLLCSLFDRGTRATEILAAVKRQAEWWLTPSPILCQVRSHDNGTNLLYFGFYEYLKNMNWNTVYKFAIIIFFYPFSVK